MPQLFVVSYHWLISFLFHMFGGKLSLLTDTEVVSLVNLVKMRLGMFSFLPATTRPGRTWSEHPTKKLNVEENSDDPGQGQL